MALLLVALIGILRSASRGTVFVGPSGANFGASEPKTADIAAVLGVLLLCVRYPLLAWRIGFVAIFLLSLGGNNHAIRAPMAIAILICYAAAGLRHGRATAWALSLLNLLPVWAFMQGQGRPLLTTLALLVIQVALDATIVSRRTGHALAEQVAQSELDEAHRALLEERTRIAREMHDVVAHHMSLIAVQAETAPYRLDDLSEGAKEEFAALSSAAREALNDVRRLLGVLRSDGPAERSPSQSSPTSRHSSRHREGRASASTFPCPQTMASRSRMRSGSAPTASSRRRSRTPAGTLRERGCR